MKQVDLMQGKPVCAENGQEAAGFRAQFAHARIWAF